MKVELYKKLIAYAKKNPDGFMIRIKKGEMKRIYPMTNEKDFLNNLCLPGNGCIS